MSDQVETERRTASGESHPQVRRRRGATNQWLPVPIQRVEPTAWTRR